MTDPKILGIDLSLTCTGLAGHGWTTTVVPRDRRGADRLTWIRDTILDYLPVELAVMEGPSYGQHRQSGEHERAGLWWLIRIALAHRGIPVAVIAPKTLKVWVTGRGTAGKDDMVREITKRFPWFEGGSDEADALGLAAAGAQHLGQPMVAMPQAHIAALDKADWPATEGQTQ